VNKNILTTKLRKILLKKRVLFSLFILFSATLALIIQGCGGGGSGNHPFTNPLGPKTASWENNMVQTQKAINADPNANWTADETWITKKFATPEDSNVLLKALPVNIPSSVLSRKSSRFSPSSSTHCLDLNKPSIVATTRPNKFSWLDKDGKNWITPVKNQYPYGTSVSFACCGALEAAIRIAKDDSNYPIDLSEWYLWYKMTDGDVPPNSGGWHNDRASDFLVSNGTVEESVMPYSRASLYPSFSEPSSNSEKHALKSWDWAIGPEQVKMALLNGPVVSEMRVYEDFKYYTGTGIYSQTQVCFVLR